MLKKYIHFVGWRRINSAIAAMAVLGFLMTPHRAHSDVPALALIPQRVVSLKPNITAILTELGVGDQIVGITRFCTKPGSQSKIVADYTSIDIEAVVALKPDVIFVSPENTQQKQVEKLRELGLSVTLLQFRTVADLKESILTMGKVLHLEKQAGQLVQGMEDDLAQVRFLVLKKYGGKNRVALIVQRKPLMVATEQTFLGDLFKQSGFQNVFAADLVAYPVFDEETLLRAKADLLIELVHDKAERAPFAGKKLIDLQIEDFLPHGKCVKAMREWVGE